MTAIPPKTRSPEYLIDIPGFLFGAEAGTRNHLRQPNQNQLILQLFLSQLQTTTQRFCVAPMYSSLLHESIEHNSNMRFSQVGLLFGPHP
jgi:hypothetical protein